MRAKLAAENRALRAELARVHEQSDILRNGGHLHRTVEDRYERIAAMKADHAVADLCAAPEVSRAGYYT